MSAYTASQLRRRAKPAPSLRDIEADVRLAMEAWETAEQRRHRLKRNPFRKRP